MICDICKKNHAVYDPYWGWLPCKECQEKQSQTQHPAHQIEFTTDAIRQQRKQFADDIEQPHRKGQLNKRWLDIYGKEKAKQRGFTDKEIREAKYVFSGDTCYYKEGN